MGVLDDIIKKSQVLNSQIQIFAGKIDNENILTDYETSLSEYEKAYFNDILAKTTIDLLTSPIKQSSYQIIIKNESDKMQQKAKSLIEDTINGLIDGFENVKQHALFSIITGSQFFEIVWNVEKFQDVFCNKIKRILPVKNENILNYLYDKKGDFAGIEIYDRNTNEKIELKKDNLFYVIHNQYFNDVRGVSELRTIIPLVKMKLSILKNTEKTIARGVGIPIAYATENFDVSNIEIYRTLLRNIANTENAYALVSKNDIEKIEFLTVNQNNVMPMLEYLNRDIFFNTLTQFLTTGLGQNGSRATAEELKSPYLIKLKTITNEIESYFQWLCNIIIDNSSLSLALKKSEYPQFKLSTVTDIDLTQLVNTISTMTGIGLKLDDNDIKYIRNLLQLPNKQENIETEGQLSRMQLKQAKITDFKVFEMEAIQNLYSQIEVETQKMIDDIINQIALDIYIAKETGKEVDFAKIYNFLYDYIDNTKTKIRKESQATAIKELKKLNRELKKSIKLNGIDETILQFIIKIVDNIQNVAGNSFIEIKNNIEKNIRYETSQIRQEIQKEIQNGRGDVFQASDIERYKYTAILDGNCCDVCHPLDGLILTKEELEYNGLNLTSPVNKNCLGLLGGNNCRCQLIPIA